MQALGIPDVYPGHEDSDQAWASGTEDAAREYIELGYSDPIQVETIAIVETYNPGAVDKVLLRDASNNQWNEVWTGTPSVEPEAARIFFISIAKPPYLVNGVRVELASSAVPGWNEIDAVAILDGSSDSIAPSIGIPDLTEVPVLYPELNDETVYLEVPVSDWFNGVAAVTFQFLDPNGVPVGQATDAQLDSGGAESGDWVGQAVLPQGSATGNYGLRIVATGGEGDASTRNLSDAFEVVELLPRPGNSFAFTKIAEIGDYAFTYPSLSYDIASFGIAPVINDHGLVAFEVDLVNNLGGGGSGIMTGDGTSQDTIVGDGDIRYFPDMARRSGRSMAINDSGWVAFKGYEIGQGGISGIYKTDGSTIVEIDSISSSASIDPPIGNAWINNNGQVSYFKYNVDTFDREVWVGDGATTTRYYGHDDVLVPDWYPGMGANGPVGKEITNIGMDILVDDGSLFSIITVRDVGFSSLTYHWLIHATSPTHQHFHAVAETSSMKSTYFERLSFSQVAASPSGNFAYMGYVEPPTEGAVGYTPGVDMIISPTQLLMTRNGIKVSGLGFGVFGGPSPDTGPSVNDLNVVAYLDGPSSTIIKRHGIWLKSDGSPIGIINKNDFLDGRRVKGYNLSRQAINNHNQVTFSVEFFDGHQAVYRADPILPQVLAPIFPVLETVDPIGGTIGYEFTGVDSGDFLKLPNSPGIEITLPDAGDLIQEISGLSSYLAKPVEVLVDDVVVGQIVEGESFDVASASGGGASSIKLRNIVATPAFGGSLGIAMEFNQAVVDVDVLASTAPLLVQPYSFPLITGEQAIIQSGSVGNGAFTFQWFKDDVALVDSSRVLGVNEIVLQINPAEVADAGLYKLVGTGPGNQASSIEVSMAAGKSYTDWIEDFYPGESNNSIIGAEATPLGDGFANIVKFAFGFDPTTPLSPAESEKLLSITTGTRGDGILPVLEMSVNPAAAGVVVVIESAASLDADSWVPLVSGSTSVTETVENGEKRFHLRLPPSLDPNQFYRVSVREIE